MRAHRFNDVFKALGNVTNDLLSKDGDAANFLCDILNGDVPDALEEVASAAEGEVADEIVALTSFVDALPSLVPGIISDIVKGGEVAVSIVEEIVTAPDAALTVIESGVKSVWSDITAGVESVVSDITSFVGCNVLGDCSKNGILSRCSSVLNAKAVAVATARGAVATGLATPGSGAPAAGPSETGSAVWSASSNVAPNTYLGVFAMGLGFLLLL